MVLSTNCERMTGKMALAAATHSSGTFLDSELASPAYLWISPFLTEALFAQYSRNRLCSEMVPPCAFVSIPVAAS